MKPEIEKLLHKAHFEGYEMAIKHLQELSDIKTNVDIDFAIQMLTTSVEAIKATNTPDKH